LETNFEYIQLKLWRKEVKKKMPESLCEGKWMWYDIMRDLETHGLPGVTINPLSVEGCSCGGQTGSGNSFYITWVRDKFLLISMIREEDALIQAFAAVLGYRPFCKYVSKISGMLTMEWDKIDPEGRFAELQADKECSLLQRLTNETICSE
jgi:hypothetical protein